MSIKASETQDLAIDAADYYAPELPLHLWAEYDATANWCAIRGLTGKDGERLPDLLSAAVHNEINLHLEAFQQRIRDCAYAIAMETALTQNRIEEGAPK